MTQFTSDNAERFGLTERQAQIVALLEGGMGRMDIADELGISFQNARDIIGGLCDHYECPSRMLPEKILEAEANGTLTPAPYRRRRDEDGEFLLYPGSENS